MTLPASGPLALTDIQTEFGGTNPIALGEYYAGGGLVPAGTSGTYGTVPSSGALSVQNFYGTTAFTPVYIEDVFSTYLWTGNGTSGQTINNGIDLSGKGGLMWMKPRTSTSGYSAYWNRNQLYDTVRGIDQLLSSNTTDAQGTVGNLVTSVTSTGFTIGAAGPLDFASVDYVSWTFREQPKFFDVVTYTGNGVSGRAISHNLGSAPGMVITKCLNNGSLGWVVWHRSLASTSAWLRLDGTDAVITSPAGYGGTFGANSYTIVNDPYGALNANGSTYVAYLFAHDAGGFGLTGTDNVVSCGSYTGDGGAGTTAITLGYEPQWLLVKQSTGGADNWGLFDNMRGLCVDNNASNDARLIPNASNAESLIGAIEPTATGFKTTLFTNYNASGQTYVYVAIRRGPMKVPTVGTTVFSPQIWTGNGTSRTITGTNNHVDLSILTKRDASGDRLWNDRLRGAQQTIYSNYGQAEVTQSNYVSSLAVQSGITIGTAAAVNGSGSLYVSEMFSRAPSFFDEVCYTGTGAGSGNAKPHNLGVVPELMIVKRRSASDYWMVYTATTGKDASLYLNVNDASFGTGGGFWGNGSTTISPTASNFYVGDRTELNSSGSTYVAYLFATCAGVSKVGSYTGTGGTITVNCGFTGGARFVMVKRTDSTGDWFYWDSARGMVSGTDPRLQLNDGASETNSDFVTTTSVGFQVVGTAASINASGGTYIYLAIA